MTLENYLINGSVDYNIFGYILFALSGIILVATLISCVVGSIHKMKATENYKPNRESFITMIIIGTFAVIIAIGGSCAGSALINHGNKYKNYETDQAMKLVEQEDDKYIDIYDKKTGSWIFTSTTESVKVSFVMDNEMRYYTFKLSEVTILINQNKNEIQFKKIIDGDMKITIYLTGER